MSDPSDRIKRGLRLLVQTVFARVDYYALYPARIVAQNADDTLELAPDSAKLPTISSVPMRLGVPGVTVQTTTGTRVLLGFEAGDPSRPVATLWEPGSVREVSIQATIKVTVNAPEVDLGDAIGTVLRQGDTCLQTGLIAPPGGGAVTGSLLIGTITSPSKVKA